MKALGIYRNFAMWRRKDNFIEFWQSNPTETDIARIITPYKNQAHAEKYLDKIIETKQVKKYYSNDF